MKRALPIISFLSGIALGLLPMLFFENVLGPINISLALALPPIAYAIGALPIVLSFRDVEKDCPYCQKNDSKKRASFTTSHIRTIGMNRIHAWGMRANVLSSFFWAEVGLLIGLAFFFVF
jgi:hypothetical protein